MRVVSSVSKGEAGVDADNRYGSLLKVDVRRQSDVGNKLGIKTCSVNPACVRDLVAEITRRSCFDLFFENN